MSLPVNKSSLLALLPVLIFSICFGCSCNQKKVVEITDQTFMPEFSGDYKSIARNYYKIIFNKNGYPAKLEGDSLINHPIYGAYVISHYLGRYNLGEDTLEQYIRKVTNVSM